MKIKSQTELSLFFFVFLAVETLYNNFYGPQRLSNQSFFFALITRVLFFLAKITMVIMKKRKENIIMKKTKTRKLSERPITKKEIRKFMEEKSFEKGQVYWLSLLQKTRGES